MFCVLYDNMFLVCVCKYVCLCVTLISGNLLFFLIPKKVIVFYTINLYYTAREEGHRKFFHFCVLIFLLCFWSAVICEIEFIGRIVALLWVEEGSWRGSFGEGFIKMSNNWCYRADSSNSNFRKTYYRHIVVALFCCTYSVGDLSDFSFRTDFPESHPDTCNENLFVFINRIIRSEILEMFKV